MIGAPRDEIGIYLKDLELVLFRELRKAFAQVFRHVLEHPDIVIRDKRDPRYEVKERVGTTLETLLGVQVSFKERRQKGCQEGDWCQSMERGRTDQTRWQNMVEWYVESNA